MKKSKIRVLVAMSGGVDSSVAALLMKKKGFQVVGAFMKNWSDTKDPITGQCSWREDRRAALDVAIILKIPLITFDFEKQYRRYVVDEMFKKYQKGVTPNPDIDCNEKVKFPLLLKAAKKIKADFLVTGHHARIKKIPKKENKIQNEVYTRSTPFRPLISGNINVKKDKLKGEVSLVKNKKVSVSDSEHYNYELLRAKDEKKDQSYFLYRLKQKELSKILFPIGNHTKKEIREIAKKNNFPNFNRKSTVGICFIGKINLKKFLQKKIKPKKGKILDPEGKQIGIHDGVYYYTIGQRIGPRFGIDLDKGKGKQLKRWYVAKKILKTNTIIAAPEGHELNFRKEIYIKNVHWINKSPENNAKILSRIRQVGELLSSKLEVKNGKYKIILNKPITGISEGQAIVLYQGKKVLGGGVIGGL